MTLCVSVLHNVMPDTTNLCKHRVYPAKTKAWSFRRPTGLIAKTPKPVLDSDRRPTGFVGKNPKRSHAHRNAQRAAQEAEGGYTDKGRMSFKQAGGVLVTGSQRTCLADALFHLLEDRGVAVGLEEVRSIAPAHEDAKFSAAHTLVSRYGLSLTRVTRRFMLKGGAELALLRATGWFVVQLRITHDKHDRAPDLHCVAYNGAVIKDNHMYSKVKVLEASDRATQQAARDVFGSLHKGLRVQVTNVYELA